MCWLDFSPQTTQDPGRNGAIEGFHKKPRALRFHSFYKVFPGIKRQKGHFARRKQVGASFCSIQSILHCWHLTYNLFSTMLNPPEDLLIWRFFKELQQSLLETLPRLVSSNVASENHPGMSSVDFPATLAPPFMVNPNPQAPAVVTVPPSSFAFNAWAQVSPKIGATMINYV